MKKHHAYGVLLATVLSISLSCNSVSPKATDTWPITEKPRAITQAVLTTIQSIPEKEPNSFIRFLNKYKGRLADLLRFPWLCLLSRFHYINEKRHRFTQWQFDDLAILIVRSV